MLASWPTSWLVCVFVVYVICFGGIFADVMDGLFMDQDHEVGIVPAGEYSIVQDRANTSTSSGSKKKSIRNIVACSSSSVQIGMWPLITGLIRHLIGSSTLCTIVNYATSRSHVALYLNRISYNIVMIALEIIQADLEVTEMEQFLETDVCCATKSLFVARA